MKVNKVIFALIFFVVLFKNTYCQNSVYFYFKGEYNYFLMTELKKIQNEAIKFLKSSGVSKVSAVESFPSYYGMQFRMGIPSLAISIDYLDKVDWGVSFDYSSTGSRNSYADYSGEIENDQVLKMYSFGLYIEKQYRLLNDLWFIAGVSTQLIKCKMETENSWRVGINRQVLSGENNCYAIGVEPNIELKYDRYYYSFGINVGYITSFTISPFYDVDYFVNLTSFNLTPINLGMDGFRVGLVLGVGL